LDGIETWMRRANLFDTESVRACERITHAGALEAWELLAMVERGRAKFEIYSEKGQGLYLGGLKLRYCRSREGLRVFP
jgi:hypothetical protein